MRRNLPRFRTVSSSSKKKKRAPNATPIPSTSSLPEMRLQTVGTELARAVFCAERQLQLGRGGRAGTWCGMNPAW